MELLLTNKIKISTRDAIHSAANYLAEDYSSGDLAHGYIKDFVVPVGDDLSITLNLTGCKNFMRMGFKIPTLDKSVPYNFIGSESIISVGLFSIASLVEEVITDEYNKLVKFREEN